MKKAVSLLIAVVMLLSLCTVTAFADNGPMPNKGLGIGGGARVGFSRLSAAQPAYVVVDKGSGVEIDNNAFPGATYDLTTNTLTLTDVDAADCSLFIWYMGDDFTIEVAGDCAVGVIYVYNQFGVYSTSLHITGTGSLTVNESKENEAAISIVADDDECCQTLSVDDSVTLHLYAASDSGLLIENYGTTAGTAAEAISVGGAGIEGVVGERLLETDYDEANLMVVYDKDGVYTDNYAYAAKSKTDPDSVYSVRIWDEESYYVSRYVYLESIGLWVIDPRFNSYSDQKHYTKEEFDAEYTIEQSEQPARIRFTTDEREANKGWELVQLKKSGEPDAVYGGSPIWGSPGSSSENPDEYSIYRLIWDADQGAYLQDTTWPYTVLTPDEMEDAGFTFVYETVTEREQFVCWCNPAPYDDQNWESHFDVIYCEDDPDTLYVKTGESYSTDDGGNRINEQIIVEKVLYDANYMTFYLPEGYENRIYVPIGEIGGTYSYVTQEVTHKTTIRYLTEDYNFNYYSTEAQLLEKAGDTSPYCLVTYQGAGESTYTLYKLELRGNGHYYAVKWEPADDAVYGYERTLEKLTAEGYSFVMADQDTPFTHVGEVDFLTVVQYTDTQGALYGVDWMNDVYAYREDGISVTFGDTTFYFATPSDVSKDALISSVREIETDAYCYTLNGAAYHHEGTGEAAKVLLGDSDCDGGVTILDATTIQRRLASLSTQHFDAKAADADEDGGVTILDATAIQRYLASLVTHEGIGTKWI